MPITHIEPEQLALSRILRITASKTSKGIMYAIAILGTAALVPGIQIPGALGAIAATVGIDAISSIIERVAYDDVSEIVQGFFCKSDLAFLGRRVPKTEKGLWEDKVRVK